MTTPTAPRPEKLPNNLIERLMFTAQDAEFHGYHGNAALMREAAEALAASETGEAPFAWIGCEYEGCGHYSRHLIFAPPMDEDLAKCDWRPVYLHPPIAAQVSEDDIHAALDAPVAEGETVRWSIIFGLNSESGATQEIMVREIVRTALQAALRNRHDK